MQYCSDTEVTDLLPSTLPTAVDTSNERLAFLTDASEEVQELLSVACPMGTFGGLVQMFPDQDDDPPTPTTVRRITKYLAASAILDRMKALAKGGPSGEAYRARAEEIVARVIAGEIHIIDEDGTYYGHSGIAATTVEGAAPVFTRGRFDSDGTALDDGGSLDDLVT